MTSGTGMARQAKQPAETGEKPQTETSSLEERIRIRAHEIWLERDGQVDGSDGADWLQAEKAIRAS